MHWITEKKVLETARFELPNYDQFRPLNAALDSKWYGTK